MVDYHTTTLARHQAQVDREASLDYKLYELREEAALTAEEICEHIASLTDEQFMQVCEALSEVANGNQNVAAPLGLLCGNRPCSLSFVLSNSTARAVKRSSCSRIR